MQVTCNPPRLVPLALKPLRSLLGMKRSKFQFGALLLPCPLESSQLALGLLGVGEGGVASPAHLVQLPFRLVQSCFQLRDPRVLASQLGLKIADDVFCA